MQQDLAGAARHFELWTFITFRHDRSQNAVRWVIQAHTVSANRDCPQGSRSATCRLSYHNIYNNFLRSLEYIIENPTSGQYALEFIRCLHRRFGARAVCCYTSKEQQPTSAKKTPELFDSKLVAAHYLVGPHPTPEFIRHLKQKHSIAGVIPHGEMFVESAINIAEALGLDWVQPEIMRRFRNKASLKAHLRQADPGLRINHTQLVHSPEEVWAAVRQHKLSRFVLKPNDGVANMNVGIFSADDPESLISEYWTRTNAQMRLLEEFISGREFHCNGQVDAEGNILITDIGETHYTETEQREIVCLSTNQVPYRDPLFAVIADYITRLIRASGLRRSPFHAELRVDENGPSLLECAARLIGADWPRFINLMHGPSFHMTDLAAHYYMTAAPYGPSGINWENYDSQLLMKVRGVSTGVDKIRQIEGVAEVESLPEFLDWTERPTIGQRLTATNSLLSSPYAVVLRCRNEEEAYAMEKKVRGLLRWNTRPLSFSESIASGYQRAKNYVK